MCHLSAYHLWSVFKSQMICRMFVVRIVLAFSGCGIMVAAVWGQHTPSRVFCRLPHSWNSSISKDWWLSLTAFQIVPGYASWKIVHAAVSLFIIIWHDFSNHLYTMSSCPFISEVSHEVELIVQSSMTFAFARALYYIKITHLWISVSICYVSGGHDDFHGLCCHCLILLSVFQWGERLLCNYPLNINTWWLGLCISHRPVIWRVLPWVWSAGLKLS